MRKWILSVALGLCILPGAQADEGMWLIQALDKALEKNMKARGLKLSAREIYNEEAGGISDAVVSLGFYCTGSMISGDGLLITNHHCAYSDVVALSTPE
ncbi:MAG: S46 family peptidase, partial [Bacteroidales bacterium]|nr:S46 family peptidase [Bacteroidales bacterium]